MNLSHQPAIVEFLVGFSDIFLSPLESFKLFLERILHWHVELSAWAVMATVFLGLCATTLKPKAHEVSLTRRLLGLSAATAALFGPGVLLWGPVALQHLASLRDAVGRPVYPISTLRQIEVLLLPPPWPLWAGAAMAGGLAWTIFFRWMPARAESAKKRLLLKTRAAREGRTDIRTIARDFSTNKKPYNPEKYFRKGFVFLGISAKKKPIYLDYSVFKRSHIQLIGTTGAGKGVAAGLMITQALRHSEAVVVLDPKADEWAPHLCRQEAERAGRPFVLIDLRKSARQINILAGATPAEVEELLVAGLGLSDRGDPADFYRVSDRRAAHELARRVLTGNPTATLADLFEAGSADPAMVESAAGLIGRLGELATVAAVCGDGGPDLAEVIADGGCVYVIGSMRHGKILAVQRALLVRLCQIIEARDRTGAAEPRHVLIFMDELKTHISRPALEMLGAIRDKRAHIILAHQSLGDLRDCPGDLSPDAVQDAVIENCKIRVAYKVMNADTAEWLASTTGKILIDDETRKIDITSALVEQATGERSIRIAERERLDSNAFLALPERVAAVFAPEILEISHIEPLAVEKGPLEPVQAPAGPAKAPAPAPVPAWEGLPDADL